MPSAPVTKRKGNWGDGRPTKLTPELQEKIVGYIRKVSYIETACQAAGIDKKTYYNWLEWGEEGREPYRTFFHAAKEAQAYARVYAAGRVLRGKVGWQGPATWLERTNPECWRRREHVEIAGDPEAPIVARIEMPDEDPE